MDISIQPSVIPITGQEKWDRLSEPERALSAFYRAFNNHDLDALEGIWDRNEAIAMDNPVGGIHRGWDEIKDTYEKLFAAADRFQVEFTEYTLHQAGDAFWTVGRERGEFRSGAMTLPLSIRTSRFFRKFDGSWRLAHHHGSIDDPDLLARFQEAAGWKHGAGGQEAAAA